ncbi:unnamed protein product, partial [Mesorhabditis belari]|uniref:Domain of unknown function DB domain-containing protein n=1 Tax=Mesorhabditis belari TaxID=2138241 RepID=A0AAF3FQH4_9BILA
MTCLLKIFQLLIAIYSVKGCMLALPTCPFGTNCTPAPPAACLFGTCAKQQSNQVGPCGSGCEPPKTCTPKGCLQTMAHHGVKTFQGNPIATSSPINPDARFLSCCQSLAVGDSCLPICTFESFNKQEISSIFFLSSQCSPVNLGSMFHCAAFGADHSSCCVNAGVDAECLTFCDQEELSFDKISPSHLKCLPHFETIKSCFYNHAIREYYRQDIVVN